MPESNHFDESTQLQKPEQYQSEINHYSNPRTKHYTLVVLTLVYSFNFIDRQLLAILQEAIKLDLSLSDAQLGLLTGFAFAVFYVIAGIPLARWSDRSNRRNIIAMAVGLWSFMTAISGLVQNFAQLLIARIGVGVGEAGGSPPSHSIISDIFPPEKRATAISFYSTGVNIGILFGFLLGGWLNEFFGWRIAFVVVGAPGILLAILVRMTVAEPIRGLSENRKATQESPSLSTVVSLLWSRSSFRHLAFAAGLTAFAGYGTTNWSASFFIRTHGMSTGELGTWLALIIGLGGAIGLLCGGLIVDRLARRDKRWYVWLPALTCSICVPFMASVYLVDNVYTALILSIIPGILLNVFLGTTIATTHSLVGLRMRATASAILFLVLNMIGLGLGPWTIGMLSDAMSVELGSESLRAAMLYVIPTFTFWAACHYYMASRTLRNDLANAPD